MKILFIFLIISSVPFLSISQSSNNYSKHKNIYLFGETHFVKEKYDEMREIIFEKIENLNQKDSVTMFFELPYSMNYILQDLDNENSLNLLRNWFNNVYQFKGKKPSYFWTDYRDFLLDLKKICNKKKINLTLKSIDTERELRRTTYILKALEQNEINTPIDSLLNSDIIENDSNTRNILIDHVKELTKNKKYSSEKKFLKTLEKSLTIDCTICLERDEFMYEQFSDDSIKNNIVFGTFGLDHVVAKGGFHKIGEYFKSKNKIDTTGYKSFYSLFKSKYKSKTLRLGILAFNREMFFSDATMSNSYENIMTIEERKFLESLLTEKKVIRIYPSNYSELKNLSLHLDHVILYKSSNYKR